jgi:transposase
MEQKPLSLTREQMEARRMEGGCLLKAGNLSQTAIAQQLGVSRATVSDWSKTMEAKGAQGLGKRKAAGSQSKLIPSQKKELLYVLENFDALYYGFPTVRWTLERVQRVIQQEFGVAYHLNYLNRLLRSLGFNPPKPQSQSQDKASEYWSRAESIMAAYRKSNP